MYLLSMDSVSRKRKLLEYDGNILSRKVAVCYSVVSEGKDEFSLCDQSSVIGEQDTEKVNEYVLQENPSQKFDKIEVNESVIDNVKKQESFLVEKDVFSEKEGSVATDFGNDCGRKDFIWFSEEYIDDIISHEMYKESLFNLSENFCKIHAINPTGREILIDWLISVQVHLKAENCTLHLAVALLDILLDSINIPLNKLQAAAVAAFRVAYKFTQGNLSMKMLLSLCGGAVTKDMVESHEILVLQTSRLIQAGGSLTVFFNYLLYKIFGFKFPPEIYYCGLYFIEIMLLQFIFVDCPACEKAITAVFAALAVFEYPIKFDLFDRSDFITKKKLQHVYRRLMRSLRIMYHDKDALRSSNVFRKYKSSRYYKISVHQNLKCLASA